MLPTSDARIWPTTLAEREVVRLWKRSGLTDGTIIQYRRFLGVFFAYCAESKLKPISELTVDGAKRFSRWYNRHGRQANDRRVLQASSRSPLFAYAWALATAGFAVPLWRIRHASGEIPSIVGDYIAYARQHRGLVQSSLARDADLLTEFVGHLDRRHRNWRQLKIQDIDRYLISLTKRLAPSTVGRTACAIRSWVRFLHAKGLLGQDLAPAIIAPVRPRYDRPPRAWPWPKVKRLLRAVDAKTPIGRRDRALFVLMSAYGLGSADVLQLRLEDIGWTTGQLHVVRPKTKRPITLPLLPGVAKAIAQYIRGGRPKFARSPYVFLSMRKPYLPFDASGVLRHRLREVARRAGINDPVLGAHIFSHSHATRQIEIGTAMKTVADILGHRDPETTSIYTRAAVRHLRRLALPIPQ